MRARLLTALLILTSLYSAAQTRRPVLIGVDVAKPILSLLTPERPAFRLGEVVVKIPVAQARYLSVVGGYGLMHSDTTFRNVVLEARGPYLKAGLERLRSSGLLSGWHGVMAVSRESASYSFRGPVFGDYITDLGVRQRVALGLEGLIGYQWRLSGKLLARVSGRASVAALLGPDIERLPTAFVPGIGQTAGDPIVYSLGLGLHLFYRTNPRSTEFPE